VKNVVREEDQHHDGKLEGRVAVVEGKKREGKKYEWKKRKK
jgi:hypothetical protein